MSPSALPSGSPTRRFWFHVARSTYVTALTDWFLGFVGKAAHLILILTTLYTGAELLPGVAFPVSVSNAVFLVQMLTLDVGGLGLAKLAMQARDQGNDTGARQAETLSRWLIRIVIVSLVTVALEQTIRAIPGLTGLSPAMEGVNIAVGGTLTIARAICAVHYGRVMHVLHATSEPVPLPAAEVEEVVQKAINDLATTIRADQRLILTQMQQTIESHLPTIEEEALARALLPHLEAIWRPQGGITPDEAQSHPSALPSPLEARVEAGGVRPVASPLAAAPHPEPEEQRQSQPSELVAGSGGSSQARLRAAYEQLRAQGQRISGRALAKGAHVSRATATTWLAARKSREVQPGGEGRDARSVMTVDQEIRPYGP